MTERRWVMANKSQLLKNKTARTTASILLLLLLSGNGLATNLNLIPAPDMLRMCRRNVSRRFEAFMGEEGTDAD